MGTEIERKFLLRSNDWRKEVSRTREIRQGYLSTEGGKASVRVRLQDDEARLNIKAAVVGTTRAEYDYEMPVSDAREIIDKLCVGVLEKKRHYVQRGAHTFEIDEFLGANAGLVVAEIELGAENEAFERPDWLGREVTAERRYYNNQLALRPYTQWPRRMEIDLAAQRLRLLEGARPLREYTVSTAAKGAGEQNGSGKTPRGVHVVRAKIGADCRPGTVFVRRRPTGEIWSSELAQAHPKRDWILSRILWLSGREPGRNRLGAVDTMRRFIYIHGTDDESTIGTPASHGCVRMRNADVIELFDLVAPGTEVLIHE
ncbi:MAG TPA: L,D-transpeptidase family protein [Nevskiaceae bacterium]|nr:L,D-transpeptidase family protein [Nevskiaceae bacterium]